MVEGQTGGLWTNQHSSPLTEGNQKDKFGNTVKPLVTEDYNAHMGYVNKNDQMSTNYGMSTRTWK
jgi:hypothetical protein